MCKWQGNGDDMAIVSSQIVAKQTQHMGERITEEHIDSLGVVYRFGYIFKGIGDTAMNLSSRAVWLEQTLADIEAQRIINGN